MLLIKRYFLPLFLVAVLYSTIYALFGYPDPFLSAPFFIVLLLSYLIRVCDDICDYSHDKSRGRAPIKRSILIVFCCLIGINALALSLLTEMYLMLAPLALILLQFLFPDSWRNFIKPLFLPAIVIALVYDAFTPNAWVFLIAFLFICVDIIIILIKRKGRNRV